MRSLRDRRNSRRFRSAQEAASASGAMVCAVMGKDGHPIYFNLPAEATEAQVEQAAFEAREGRPMNDAERWVAERARRA